MTYFEDELEGSATRRRIPHANDGERARIMIVEDDRVSMLFLEKEMVKIGADVESVTDAEAAWALLKAAPKLTDILLLDRNLPNIDGLTLLKHLKASPDHRNIPVILQTVAETPEELREGMALGAFYYLTKPIDSQLLHTVISAALREVHLRQNLLAQIEQYETGFSCLRTAEFKFCTLAEAQALSGFLARMLPYSDAAITSLAALMINAVEHGNLDIGYELKAKLLATGHLEQEIKKRQATLPYKSRSVTVKYQSAPEGIYITIQDEGKGFDWNHYLDLDPRRGYGAHGRGIAQAKLSGIDHLSYNKEGNQVTIFIKHKEGGVL